MKNDTLKASKRDLTGTNNVRKLRNDHYIPGVLYGHHIDNVNIKVSVNDFDKFFKKHGTGASLNLDIDGEQTFVLFKDVQLDRMRNLTTHVEFQALSMGEKIKIKVPIHYVGRESIPAGVIFQELHHEVEMQVLPKDLIESITVDISSAQLGEHGLLGDLPEFKNDAFEITEHADTMLYTVSEPSLHFEDEEEAEEVTEVPEIGKEE